jgi:hypothetical protein
MRLVRRRRLIGHASFLGKWLSGWRGIIVTLAVAVLMTGIGLYVEARSNTGLNDPAFRLVAQAAGAANLLLFLRVVSAILEWLRRQSVRLGRRIDRFLSGQLRVSSLQALSPRATPSR